MRISRAFAGLVAGWTVACNAGPTNPPAPAPPPAPGVQPPPPPPPPGQPPTGSATIQDLGLLSSALLGNSRRVQVYLPPGYVSGTASYPVLYLHDGNDIFGSSTVFYMERTLTPLILSGAVRPVIVVAIGNRGTDASRGEDYWPVPPKVGAMYARMIVEELKPRIDATYRTIPGPATTGIGGQSLGGVISWYIALTYPSVFGILLSQSGVVLNNDGTLDYITKVQALPGKPPLRIWYDRGTADGESWHQGREQQMRAALLAKGLVEGQDFKYLLVNGAVHSWSAWALRIDPFMRFLFPGQ